MDASVEMQILQRLTAVETKLDLQLNAKDVAMEALSLGKNNENRLNKHEDSQKWLWRSVGITALGILAKWVYSG